MNKLGDKSQTGGWPCDEKCLASATTAQKFFKGHLSIACRGRLRVGRLLFLRSRSSVFIVVGVSIGRAIREISMLSLNRAHVTSVVTGRPANNLVTPVVNLVAEGLHRKDSERFFKLGGKLFNTEKEDGKDGSGGDHSNVVPSSLHGLVKSKRKQPHPDSQVTSQVTRVLNNMSSEKEANSDEMLCSGSLALRKET